MSHFTYIKTRFQNLFYLGKALNKLNISYEKQRKVIDGSKPYQKKLVFNQLNTNKIMMVYKHQFQNAGIQITKKKFILVAGEKIYLDPCKQNLKYLFKVLEDKGIPFEEKEKITRSIFSKYLNLKTMNGRVTFVLCIVLILYILSIQNQSGFIILLKNLIRAIREGKISKAIGRAIVRRLQKKGVDIDPELLDIVNS